jgi:hypothetical protein
VPTFVRYLAVIVLMAEEGVQFGRYDPLGLIADGATSMLVATVVVLLARLHRAAGATLLLLWGAANYANFEHLLTLGTMANLQYVGYLGDATFLQGSAMAPSRPALLLLCLLVPGMLGWFGLPPRPARLMPWPTLGLTLCLGVITLRGGGEGRSATWRRTHVLIDNVQSLLRRRGLPPQLEHIDGVYPGSLQGEPRLSRPGAGVNVLLILLEGVSGSVVDPDAEASPMPRLSALAGQNVLWRNFVNQQRQTNRGEYAILCGELPKLVTDTPHMAEYSSHSLGLPCLPRHMAEHGYDTAYIQSAPLEFMNKDEFMVAAGFQRILGASAITAARARTNWGVDDRSFFEHALQHLRRLDTQSRPWFATLLTVGTHHRYIVPRPYRSPYRHGSFEEAMHYLDAALGGFVAALKQQGLLQHTLVLITADEANEKNFRTRGRRSIQQAHGFLVALLPGGDTGTVDEPYMQMDLPLSISDYLGLARPHDPAPFAGRSLFRRYGTERPLFFANTYERELGYVRNDELLVCPESLDTCQRYTVDPEKPLWGSLTPAGAAGPEDAGVQFLAGAASRSMRPPQVASTKMPTTR